MDIIKNYNFYCKVLAFFILLAIFLFAGCGTPQGKDGSSKTAPVNWAEKLGFPSGKRVLIFHADDMGMCDEANEAVIYLLANGYIQSAAAMATCPAYEAAIKWALNNPGTDVGIHLTLCSEWNTCRWGTVADPIEVPGLLDSGNKMWRRVQDVVINSNPEEVETELSPTAQARHALIKEITQKPGCSNLLCCFSGFALLCLISFIAS